VKPSILGRGAALDGLDSRGANADAIGPTTDRVDQRSVLVKPATLDVSFWDTPTASVYTATIFSRFCPRRLDEERVGSGLREYAGERIQTCPSTTA
jgi:hypothetical protein